MKVFKPEVNGDTVLRLWRKAQRIPGGQRIFSRFVGRMAPYTATIKARVLELDAGYARLRLEDRREIRNHLGCIHAIALVNFLEETTGLAMISRFSKGLRGIVTRIEIDYVKKARGTLAAECRVPEVDPDVGGEYTAEAEIKDARGDVVARGRAHWRVGRAPKAVPAA
jgi:acyl-coenzyme A thioesterase PaaI-like protein